MIEIVHVGRAPEVISRPVGFTVLVSFANGCVGGQEVVED